MAPNTASEAVEQRLDDLARRSIIRLMPFILAMMFMSYVDRANIAILNGPITRELGFSATAFGFAVGLFFWGYVIFEVPSNILMVKFGARAWLARIMITWGLITGCMFFAQEVWHFALLRFLLGVAEAGLSPGILLFITMWFPRSRQARPLSYFQLSIPLAMIFGSVLTSGLLGLFESLVGELTGWRWVFLTEAVLTILLGIVILFTIPDNPAKARFVSAEDAELVTERIRQEQADKQDDALSEMSEGKRILLTLGSGKAWYLSIMYLAMLTGWWAVTFWLPQTIAEGFETTAVVAGLLSAIPWVLALFGIIFVRASSVRTGDRKWHLTIALAVGAAGLVLSAATTNPYLSFAGMTLAVVGVQSAIPVFYRFQTVIFTGVMTAVLLAMVNSVGNFGGFIGPYLFGFSKDSLGGVAPALWFMGAFLLVAALMGFFAEKVLGLETTFAATASTQPPGPASAESNVPIKEENQ